MADKVSVEGVSDVENLMKQGEQSLESREYEKANGFYQKVIDIDAENHEAWWGKHEAIYCLELQDIFGGVGIAVWYGICIL